MFKRLFWMLVGATFGAGASFWVARAVRQTVQRYTPARVSGELSDAVRSFRRDLSVAVAEGRDAMREREQALRAQLQPAPPARR